MNVLNSTVRQKISDVDIHRSETSFTFVINDALEFLDSRDHRGSEFFYCRSMRFFLDLKHNVVNQDSYLAVQLTRFNPSDEYSYSMRTSFELRLLNFLGKPDKVVEREYAFEKNESEAFGRPDFIRVNELINSQNGWTQADTLKMQVHLKCHEFRRTN